MISNIPIKQKTRKFSNTANLTHHRLRTIPLKLNFRMGLLYLQTFMNVSILPPDI